MSTLAGFVELRCYVTGRDGAAADLSRATASLLLKPAGREPLVRALQLMIPRERAVIPAHAAPPMPLDGGLEVRIALLDASVPFQPAVVEGADGVAVPSYFKTDLEAGGFDATLTLRLPDGERTMEFRSQPRNR